MASLNRARLLPIRQPLAFEPTKTWTKGRFVYRYDPVRKICRRSPLTDDVSVGTQYFKVITEDSAKTRRSLWVWRMVQATSVAVFLIAALALTYPMLPEIAYRAHQGLANRPVSGKQLPSKVIDSKNRLIIPKIGVNAAILEGPDLSVLNHDEGVWHQTGDSPSRGNLVLAGHRFKYLPPNSTTLFNLDKLQVGDTLVVDWQGKRLLYVITVARVVPATEVKLLNQTPKPQLTVYTCNEKSQANRVAVIAEPVPEK